ncbi:helicase [Aspergillus luchuensis]|uniref:Helicase n=1 Tax=Aspergillus kawachii TaxID=1069201 RepID=A0A146FI18_ASPKA|nr:helicase [Aspergillus luchuensis]
MSASREIDGISPGSQYVGAALALAQYVVSVGYWRGRINDEQIVNIALETATTLIECGFGAILSLCYHFCIGKPCKVGIYIGTTGTSSRGLTLTNAAHVILMETNWCSTKHKQVFGRCHRIDQRAKVVFAHVLPKYPNRMRATCPREAFSKISTGKDNRLLQPKMNNYYPPGVGGRRSISELQNRGRQIS